VDSHTYTTDVRRTIADVCRVSEMYRMWILTPYTTDVRNAIAGVCRASERYRMWILTPYKLTYGALSQVCVGCQKGIVCGFSHPTQLTYGALLQVCVGCQKVTCILLRGIVCGFSHPTHLPCRCACFDYRDPPHFRRLLDIRKSQLFIHFT